MTSRASFSSQIATVATMIGVAVGLGNVWRFPYMVGRYGGAAFVLFYVGVVLLIGVPALIAEWSLGRSTRRGPVGAFARAGMPGGTVIGWLFFVVVVAAAGYYTNAIGWVLYYAVGELVRPMISSWPQDAILPPAEGFDPRSFGLQLVATTAVILTAMAIVRRGLRRGIERASKILMPVLLISLLIMIARGLTLPGAAEGVAWYIWKVDPTALTPQVMLAALGQACFTLSLGGTFMVVYGSYLGENERLGRAALLTASGDLGAGLLAGLAILPPVIALGLSPNSGPGLLFQTLPQVFAAMPAGWLFGVLFYLGLLGAAFLSDVAAFEVLTAGLTDNTTLDRRRASWLLAGIVFLFALPPMINMRIFVPWDLTFGSGMQTLGALAAVVAVGWRLERAKALHELQTALPGRGGRLLYAWLRWVVPAAMFAVGGWWLATEVLGWFEAA